MINQLGKDAVELCAIRLTRYLIILMAINQTQSTGDKVYFYGSDRNLQFRPLDLQALLAKTTEKKKLLVLKTNSE